MLLLYLSVDVWMLSARLLSSWFCYDEVYVVSHIRDLKSWKQDRYC